MIGGGRISRLGWQIDDLAAGVHQVAHMPEIDNDFASDYLTIHLMKGIIARA
jgi:hypothetical protein